MANLERDLLGALPQAAMQRVRVLAIVAVVAIAGAVAMGAGSVTTFAATETTAPAESLGSAPAADDEWTQVVPGGDCECADGSEFSFWVREADPTKVLFFLQGGGACFTPETCSFTDGTYRVTADASRILATSGGIFDLDNPENPFADYSMIYVPYCTGDVHLGDATHEYAPELTAEHNGLTNGKAALAYLAEHFADAESVVVVGESAGSIASPFYGALVADELPDAAVTVFGDGSGGYPDVADLNASLGGLWGIEIPDWPENEGLTREEWSFPALWVQAGRHAPRIVFGRFDYAYDEAQVFYAELAGLDADELIDLIDSNEERIEADGVDQHSFTAPGSEHAVVQKSEFYTTEVDGVRLVDWVVDLIDGGDPPPDVRCADCGAPGATTSRTGTAG